MTDTTDRTEVVADDLVDRFELLQWIGEGGYAHVHRAREKSTGREVAIKICKHQHHRGGHYWVSLEREAWFLRRLSGLQGCVTQLIEDHSDDQRCPYLVLGLLKGETLWHRLEREGRLQPREAAEMTIKILRLLRLIHNRGVIHGEPKPKNVFLCEDGRIVLIDFGTAEMIDRSVYDGPDHMVNPTTVVGTPEYFSPEAVHYRPITVRSDLYVVGSVLYKMLTGRAPYEGRSDVGCYNGHRDTATPFLPVHHPLSNTRLERVIRRALNKFHDQRYACASRMIMGLHAHKIPT